MRPRRMQGALVARRLLPSARLVVVRGRREPRAVAVRSAEQLRERLPEPIPGGRIAAWQSRPGQRDLPGPAAARRRLAAVAAARPDVRARREHGEPLLWRSAAHQAMAFGVAAAADRSRSRRGTGPLRSGPDRQRLRQRADPRHGPGSVAAGRPALGLHRWRPAQRAVLFGREPRASRGGPGRGRGVRGEGADARPPLLIDRRPGRGGQPAVVPARAGLGYAARRAAGAAGAGDVRAVRDRARSAGPDGAAART